MRTTPLSPEAVIRAIERFAPQARPYNFDDMFDCWGFQRRLFDYLDDGFELNEELSARTADRAKWERFETRETLLPGDILTSHPHPDADFHTVVYAGQVGGLDLVFDTSSRGKVPLFEGGRLSADRQIFTRFMRASETSDRLRHDGGAYLRLWDDRMRYLNVALHRRLAAGNPRAERDLVKLRRVAGFTELPFYCRTRLPRDAHDRELYDNRETRALDYYTPDGAALQDDAYEAAGWNEGRGAPGEAQPLRPAPPALIGVPHRLIEGGDWTVNWRPAPVDAWRVEVWEETHDLWKHRLLRRDLGPSATSFTVPPELLGDGRRFAVALFARDHRGWSGSTLATALRRPETGHPLLGYNAVRPGALRPDLLEPVSREGERFELRWSIPEPALTQVRARVRLFEDACLADDATPRLDLDLNADDAAGCRCVVPAALLRSGHTYAWYVDALDGVGRWTFAPAEGVFVVE